jgi:hypothetical protein
MNGFHLEMNQAQQNSTTPNIRNLKREHFEKIEISAFNSS